MKRLFNCAVLGLVLAAVAAAGGQPLRYHFDKATTYRYAVTSESKMNGEMMGQEMTIEMRTEATVAVTASAETKDGGWELIVRMDAGKAKVNFPMMGLRDTTIELTELLGKRSKLIIDGRGKTLSVTPIDTVAPSRLMMMLGGGTEMFSRMFMELPVQAVDVKSAWKDTNPDTMHQRGVKIVMKKNVDYSIPGTETRGGYSTLQIAFTGATTMTGAGNQNGLDVTVDGTVKSNGTLNFAPKEGLMVELSSTSNVDQTVTFSGAQNGAQTSVTSSKTTAKLLK